jgi:predicted nucleotidyltransferase
MDNEQKILKQLFLKPTYRFHIRELARETDLNPNTIINLSDKLEKQGLVSKKRNKNLVEVSLNFENKKTVWLKKLFNLSQIYESGIIDFLVTAYQPNSISLIGSYSRGEDIEKSDIDLVVITNKKEVIDVSEFETKLHRTIHLLIAQKEKMSGEFFNNLINGVVVYGAIKP